MDRYPCRDLAETKQRNNGAPFRGNCRAWRAILRRFAPQDDMGVTCDRRPVTRDLAAGSG